jgi:hypothetical protein
MSKDSKFIVKGKRSFKDGNSAFLADRALPEEGKKSFKDEPSAFLAKRGEPETGSATFNDSRYK